MKKIIYIVIEVVSISLFGLIIGKFTIGFISSALLLLITGSFGLSVSQQSIGMISDNLSFLGILLFMYFYVRKVKKHKTSRMNINQEKIFLDTILGSVIGVCICSAVIIIALCSGSLKIEFSSFNTFILVCSFWSVLVQAGIEEILFRGYLIHELKKECRSYMAILISSVVFAAVHLFNHGITILSVINIFLVSIFLALHSTERNSLYFVIGFHTFWNYTEEMVFGLPNSGIITDGTVCKVVYGSNNWFYNQSFGIEASIQTTIVFIFLSIILMCMMKRKVV